MKVVTIPQSGRCGPVVYARTRFGLVARAWVQPRNPRTQVQQANRGAFATVSQYWHGLSDDQKNAWNLYAVGKYSLNTLGVQVPRSGHSCYMSLNLRQAHLSLPLFDTPPAPAVIPPNPVGELVATNTNGHIAIKLAVPSAPVENTLVEGPAPQSSGVRCVQHFPFLGLLPTPVNGYSDITAMIVARYGILSAGTRIFIRTRQQVDGMVDVPKLVSVRIPAATP